MLNKTDLQEYYEMLDRKQAESSTAKNPSYTNRQIDLLQELIRLQQNILGINL